MRPRSSTRGRITSASVTVRLQLLIELFSLGVTAELLRAKRDRKSPQRGQFDPKFQVEGVAPTNHFCTFS